MIDYISILKSNGLDPLELDARTFIAVINAMAAVNSAAHAQGYNYAIQAKGE